MVPGHRLPLVNWLADAVSSFHSSQPPPTGLWKKIKTLVPNSSTVQQRKTNRLFAHRKKETKQKKKTKTNRGSRFVCRVSFQVVPGSFPCVRLSIEFPRPEERWKEILRRSKNSLPAATILEPKQKRTNFGTISDGCLETNDGSRHLHRLCRSGDDFVGFFSCDKRRRRRRRRKRKKKKKKEEADDSRAVA